MGGGFDNLGDLYASLIGNGGPMAGQGRQRGGGRGSDMQSALEVDFREAALGTRRTLRTGSGQTVDVNVPAGVESGARLRVSGQGGQAPKNGRPGDLYLDISVRPDPHLQRNNYDVELSLPLTIAEACLGTQVDVPTVDGSVRLTVPPGTSSAAKLRLRGKGIKRPDGTRGDQFCRIEIQVPKFDANDKEARRLLDELDHRAKQGKVRNF